jgi:hypothetical protein
VVIFLPVLHNQKVVDIVTKNKVLASLLKKFDKMWYLNMHKHKFVNVGRWFFCVERKMELCSSK